MLTALSASLLSCSAPLYEGSGIGECTDQYDNDDDGYIDCDDNGCADDPDCIDTDTGTDAPDSSSNDAVVRIHDEVNTVLVVDWLESRDTELSWIEYRFEDTTLSTPPLARLAGEHSTALLGIPALTEVTLQIFSQVGDKLIASEVLTAETGALPSDLPEPSLQSHEASLASPEDWALISVDTAEPGEWYSGPYYIIILDRQARVVWYYEVPDNRVSMFPQLSLDGTHLVFDASTAYFSSASDPYLHRLSLDFSYDERVDVDRLIYGFTEVEGGGFIRDYGGWGEYSLVEQSADGELRTIWDCDPWLSERVQGNSICYTNAVNYSPQTNTILWSLPYHDTVVEIDRDSGEVIRVLGELSPTHDTVPSTALFDFQHYPSFTPDGTLLVSMHIEGTSDQQRAREYAIDDESKTMTEIWSYGEGIDEYAYYSGEAYRLANGNTLMNYGTGGAAREVTADKQVVWDIAFPDRHLNGHLSLIDDLYALLGPE